MHFDMSVKEIMNPRIFTVDANITVKEAAAKMAQLRIGSVLVGSVNDIQGIFSERDLLNKVVGQGLSVETTTIKEVMTRNVLTIDSSRNPEVALKMMEEKGIRHLPVVNQEGYCIGMVGMRDLMGTFVEYLEQENEALAQYIMADGPGG